MLKKKLLGTVMIAMLALPAGAMAENNETSGEVDLTDVLTNEMVTPFANENVGGGNWDYGTRLVLPLNKEVYSNYYHKTKDHGSSCSIGTKHNDSGRVSAGITSYSSATGKVNDKTKANWRTY